jgi:hypothetical protein
MSQQVSQQYACTQRIAPSPSVQSDPGFAVRAQKSVGLVGGSPTYGLVEAFRAPDETARTYQYSPDGRLYALAVPSWCVDDNVYQ